MSATFVIPESYRGNRGDRGDIVDIPGSALSDEEHYLFCKAVKMLYCEDEFNTLLDEDNDVNRTLIMLVYKLKFGLKGQGLLAQYFK